MGRNDDHPQKLAFSGRTKWQSQISEGSLLTQSVPPYWAALASPLAQSLLEILSPTVVLVVQWLSGVQLLQPHGLQPDRLLCPWDSLGKNTGVGCHSLLQGIFPTQESNPGLPHCRQILYQLNYKRSPRPYLKPEEGNGNPLHYSCLGTPMGREDWQAIVHGLPEWLSCKESACNAGEPGLIPEWESFPGEGIDYTLQYSWASLVVQTGKNLPAVQETWGLIPGLGRSPGGGHGNPLQYSCLENPMDRGACQATVHGVAKSWTRLEQLSPAHHSIDNAV